jgi:saccharopepsin
MEQVGLTVLSHLHLSPSPSTFTLPVRRSNALTWFSITVASQAFLDASSAENAVLDYGTSGVMGLGFNSLSTIDAAVNASSSSNGRSLLYNLFYDNPSTPNFIAFSLQRSEDSDADEVIGTFSVGELNTNYTKVNSTDPIPTFPPVNPNRWNVLLEALFIGNTSVPLSSQVNGAPSDKAVILLDSGSSYTCVCVLSTSCQN